MLLFPILFLLFFGLQWLHWRFLRHLLPEQIHPFIPWVLALLHVPLVCYMGLRFSGFGTHGLGWLQPLARGAFYFQALTILNLIGGFATEALYRLTHRKRTEGTLELPSRRAFLQGAATAGMSAVAVGSGFGWAQAYGDPVIARHDLYWPDLAPGLDGLRILHLSDLHAGPLVNEKTLRRWREAAQREQAEIAVLTGDVVDSMPEEMTGVVAAFAGFPAPLGRYAVLGNHDYFADPGPIWEGLESAGFRCLENAQHTLTRAGSTLAVIGLQDPQALNGRWRGVRFGPGPRPDVAMKGVPEGAFRLCLAHRPGMWRLAKRTGAHLTLAGHTHGGQVNLIPGVNFARMLGPYTEGLFQENGQRLFVSRGLGVVGVPMRVGAPPEIVVITLRRG